MKMSITNKENLKDYIHGIHDYLRNNGAGIGMTALKMFNVVYGLMMIEKNEKLFQELFKTTSEEESRGITIDTYRFSELVKLAKENSKDSIHTLEVRLINTILDKLADDKFLRRFIFYEIPKDLDAKVYSNLVLKVDSISDIEAKNNLQLSGKIYEYFIGRDKNAISDLGAYFTDRYIVNYIYELIKPTLNDDGTVKSMIDPFGGSGGFTIGYTDYLIKNYENINWKTEINKIFHYDLNEDVIKSAALELMCLTGVIPNIDFNVFRANSFQREFVENSIDYIITNPPYGGDKNKKSSNFLKNEKIIKYINDELKTLTNTEIIERRKKQLNNLKLENKNEEERVKSQTVTKSNCSDFIKDYADELGLEPNDKEACSLLLMMKLLKDEGTCVGVLKEGVFFDGKYSDLRKALVRDYNVTKVISVSADAFENTQTKTSIVVFHKTVEKTSKIDFYDLIVTHQDKDLYSENEEGDIEIIKLKDDVLSVEDKYITSATLAQLIEKEYILDGKRYDEVVIECGEGFELKKFTDLCEFMKKSKRPASFAKDDGEYNFYSSSDTIKKCDVADYNESYILIGDGGNSCLHIDKNFSCSSHMHIIKPKINLNYFYFIFTGIFETVRNKMHGSTIKNLTKEMLNETYIPVPINSAQLEYWSSKIGTPYDAFISAKNEIDVIEKNIQDEIKRICDEEECESILFDNVFIYNQKKEKLKASDGLKNGKYRFYTSSQDKILYRNSYEFEEYCILIGRGGNVSIHLSHKFSVSHDDVYVISLKTNNLLKLKYFYYFLKINTNIIEEKFKGSTIKHISKASLSELTLKIPINKDLITNLQHLFDRLEQLHEIVINSEKEYKQNISELCHAAIKNYQDPIETVEEVEPEVVEELDIPDNVSVASSITASVGSTSSKKSKSSTKSDDRPQCSAIVKKTGLRCENKAKDGCEFCGVHGKKK